ncbi:MAG: hypothetical protein LBB11_03575, partial [Puniceicoccales bacterium]|nr:hypothetical protein [Puniceicoccales bacterium]
TEISDRDIEDYNAQIREIVNKYRKTGSLDVSFWPQKGYLKVTGDFDKVPFAVRIPNEDGAKLRELIEKKNKYDQEMHPSFFFINFTPTNDLSSRIRAHISYLVFAANINHWMKNNGLFPLNLEICIDQNVEKRIEHFYNPSIDKTEIDHYWSTPLKLLVNKFYKNNVFSERVRKEKIDHIFRALGISLAYFSNDLKRSQKVFFNEITMENKDDGAFQDLSLLCIYIANPFSGIIGQAGFNGHGRLILQY